MGKLNGRKIEAMHILYGSESGTCKDCHHLLCNLWDKNYYKCALYGVSHSEATDWRLSWPACGMINHDPEMDWVPVIKRYERVRIEEQIPGQIEMEF